MKKIKLLLVISFVFVLKVEATIIHVDVNATGSNNGSSWTDAFTDLQTAFTATLPGDSIWVAQGVYKPTTTTTRSISFVLPNGVKTFGGFNATELLFSQRNFLSYVTILSGDIGVIGNTSDNSYHVVATANVSNTTVLDGFKIISGNATNGPGGGLFNSSGNPSVSNCIFEYNLAETGGAVSQFNGGQSTFTNCTFQNNICDNYGGAIEVRAGSFFMFGCKITSNVSGLQGGGLYLYGGTIHIDRTVISGNSAASAGGAINSNYYSALTLTNSLIAGNHASNFSAISISSGNSNGQLILGCTIADNFGSPNTSTCVATNNNTIVGDCIFRGNADAVELDYYTSTVDHCMIEGGFTGPGANQIFTSNPGFISPGNSLLAPFDAAAYNYHVNVLSPAVDAGDSNFIVAIYVADLDNNDRIHGQNIDIGCYENPYCAFNLAINASGNTNICPGSNVTLTASSGTSFLWSNAATTSAITVSNAGIYSLAVDSAGCLGNASQQVIVFSANVSITGNATICPGDSTMLTAVGGNIASYSWNTSATSNTIYATIPGTFNVTVLTNDGCTATDSFVVSSASSPAPVVSYSGGLLSTGSFATYQWLLNNTLIPGATGNPYFPTQNGNYSVIVTNSFGCADTSTSFAVIDVGIVEFESQVFTLFPNPCEELLSLTFNSSFTTVVDVEITDMAGRLLITKSCPSTDIQHVDVSFLQSGTYIVTVKNDSGIYASRFIKK